MIGGRRVNGLAAALASVMAELTWLVVRRLGRLGAFSGPGGGDSVLVELEQVVGHRC
jgi:hypothetical protein